MRRFASPANQSSKQQRPPNQRQNRSLRQSHSTMVPAWLQRAQEPDYIERVLRVLEEREQLREEWRSASRPPYLGYPTPEQPPASPQDKALIDFYSVSIGGHDDHRISNRYADIEPYDRTRLDPGGRYLNANWVRELHGKKWWIATQAPLSNTAYTFLSVLLEPVSPPGLPASRVRTVVQLTKDVEGGRRKAHPYFPDTIGLSAVVREAQEQGVSDRSFEVTLIAKKIIEEAHCTQSTVVITPRLRDVAQGQPVTFNHMLYTAWPDHGVPEHKDHQALINFIAQVEKTNRMQPSPRDDPDPPVMVNCSAGVGRTGAFIALSSLLRSLSCLPPAPISSQSQTPLPPSPLGPLPPEISEDLIVQEIDSCREQRPGMVQTAPQVIFLYPILEKVSCSR
ncbi:protein-tyrosine phosphatase-like protein [Thelephora terrestris]|uniref:Protein-tyrosine phosphatase-like protein n=1 Tax=Thelephora terrestris TaxID=56493 RepID=A0A9P6L842_9AGAM|nr:protein-tyrosine phosphatase-like protein [Thelephora terrestris]